MQNRKRYNSLDEIFNDADFHLIEEKKKVSNSRTPDERLLASFLEINDFVEKNERIPEANISNVMEFKLYSRLKALREDADKAELLKAEDKYDLLPDVLNQVAEDEVHYGEKQEEEKEINSIDDLLDDDLLAGLSDDDEGLFDFKHTPKETSMPEYVARRKPCKDFAQFEQKLKQCQNDLQEGKRKVTQFRNEQQIDKGYFFVLKGVLLYVADIGDREVDEKGKVNARLRCIFENGTESDMLLRSLSAELYKDGRRVTEHEDKMLGGLNNITEEDEESGYIYILSSLSNKEEIISITDLYKIGYSSTTVEERIRDAENQTTYLMAPVKIESVYKCFNMNTQKFEQLIHQFFGATCLDIEINDKNGIRHMPREWFIVPLDVIEEAVAKLITGEIVNYRYDIDSKTIIKK